MSDDAAFMRLALRLGRKGLGRTSPNPPVGAVVVRQGRVVGRGYHRRAGEEHGEAAALRDAGARARGATLYVTLEPCTHQGRTPPCSEAVFRAGIRRVVVGARDPNPSVSGNGIGVLRRRGLKVDVGVEAAACEELVAAFAKHARSAMPLVTLKLAASLDGRIATRTGASRWITGAESRRFVHRLRDQADAVMVGANTVITDDPALTCRLRGGRDPLRVIVDGRLRIPLAAQVLSAEAAPGTIVATAAHKPRFVQTLRSRGASVLVLPGKRGVLSLRKLLRELGRRGVLSVLIEGGATLAASALREGVVDRLLLFQAPKLIGSDGRPMIGALGVNEIERALELADLRVSRVGTDVLIRARLGG